MELATDRLRVRSFRRDDLDAYAEIVADPEVMRYLGGPLTRSQARAYIERSLEHERTFGFGRYGVVRDGGLIGMCGYAPVRDYVDLGYRFTRSSWGNGFATEAARAVIDYGFSVLGLHEIVAMALIDNTDSIRVIEKLGFTFVREETTPGGFAARRFTLRREAV